MTRSISAVVIVLVIALLFAITVKAFPNPKQKMMAGFNNNTAR
jgi:hypothetical protein